jgi:hypothetical protein
MFVMPVVTLFVAFEKFMFTVSHMPAVFSAPLIASDGVFAWKR